MDKLTLVKIGGHVIDDVDVLGFVLEKFVELPGKKLLVHGGGKKASYMSEKLGIKPQLIEGRRITDAETLEVVTMVYGGLVNKNIVARLQALGANSIGLSGADANVIPAHKRVHNTIDYGFVGDFETNDINSNFIEGLVNQGLTPVFCALTHDKKGSLLNTNADTLASGLAISLSVDYDVKLIYCFEKAGVLLDLEDNNSLVRELTYLHYQQLKDDRVITNGMVPKLDNAFNALHKGIRVEVKDALNLGNKIGTTLIE